MNDINIKNIRQFAYENSHLIKGEIKGVIFEFVGLYTQNYYIDEEPSAAFRFAEKGLLYVIPYYDPWAWMNRRTVSFCRLIFKVITEGFSLENLPFVVCGASMGGMGAMIFSIEGEKSPVACVTNCPVCDLNYHYIEHDDMPRTIYQACYEEGRDLQESIAFSSPIARIAELPKIKYSLFQCMDDEDVHPYAHSEKLVPKMKSSGYDIDYIKVPNGGHCGLNSEYLNLYYSKIEEAFYET